MYSQLLLRNVLLTTRGGTKHLKKKKILLRLAALKKFKSLQRSAQKSKKKAKKHLRFKRQPHPNKKMPKSRRPVRL